MQGETEMEHPRKDPWKRYLEQFVAMSWMIPLICTCLCTVLSIYAILWTNFAFIPFLYLVWLYYDRDTPNRGGRRSEFIRNLSMWTHGCDYFSTKLIKTAELDPEKNYLFCNHPHGILCIGIFVNLGTEASNAKNLFPHHQIKLLSLGNQFLVPYHREYVSLSGICSASKESMNYLLSKPGGGQIAVLVPGGASEVLDSHPDSYVLHLQNRKGFIKVALQNGAPLVPVFTFGETDIYDHTTNPEGSLLRKIQNKLFKLTGLPFIFFRSIFPRRVPLTTVVGSPIPVEKIDNPSQDDIDTLHEKYVDALFKLFYTYRDEYAPNPKVDLKIVSAVK